MHTNWRHAQFTWVVTGVCSPTRSDLKPVCQLIYRLYNELCSPGYYLLLHMLTSPVKCEVFTISSFNRLLIQGSNLVRPGLMSIVIGY